MKSLALSLILAVSAFAQTVTVAVTVGSVKPTTITLPAPLVASLTAFMATQTIPNPADGGKTQVAKYADISALIVANLKTGLFASVLSANPPASLTAKQAIVDAAKADLEATKTAALP